MGRGPEFEGGTTFHQVALWGELVENVAVFLHSREGVDLLKRVRSRSFETAAGERRTRTEVVADELSPSLRYATATVTKSTHGTGDGAGGELDGDEDGVGDELAEQMPF